MTYAHIIEIDGDDVTLLEAANGKRYGTLGGVFNLTIDYVYASDWSIRQIFWDHLRVDRDDPMWPRLHDALVETQSEIISAELQEIISEFREREPRRSHCSY